MSAPPPILLIATASSEREGLTVAQVAKKHGISEQTIYTWRKKFGGLDPTDVKRLKQLEQLTFVTYLAFTLASKS